MRSLANPGLLLCGFLSACVPLHPTTADAARHRHIEDWSSPDYDDGDLEPIGPERCGDAYETAVRDLLFDGVDSGVSMLCIPSFSPEYSVALVDSSSERIARPEACASGAQPWRLVVSQATQQIWAIWPRTSALCSEAELAARVPIRRTSVPLDTETAAAIFDAWFQVVSRTRYPHPGIRTYPDGSREVAGDGTGSDGETYTFDALGYHGETWSPRRGMAGDLVRLADRLIRVAELEPAARGAELLACRREAVALFERGEPRRGKRAPNARPLAGTAARSS